MSSRSAPTSLAKKLGARIRALRAEAALTQERLAWESGLNKAYLSQVESGLRTPSLPVLWVIARRLGVELADLVAVNSRNPRLQLLDATRTGDVDRAEEILRRMRGE